MAKEVEVILSPRLYDIFDTENSNVVVVDVLRATSAICAAFESGVKEIKPVRDVYQALELKEQGWLAAAERNGNVVPGFDFGNSPHAFMQAEIKGKGVVLTTTNGTKAIDIASESCKDIYIGSFINLDAIANLLVEKGDKVVILCAGWKDRYCMEDSIFAGALVELLLEKGYETSCDSAKSVRRMWKAGEIDLKTYLSDCSHRLRLGSKNLDDDIDFCLTPNQSNLVPVLKDGVLKIDA